MAKISGKCGQNSGGYTFWLEYTVTHQPSSLTTNVSVTAYLKTQGSSTWNTFSTSSKLDLTINIGGNKHTKTWSSGKSFTTSKKTYTLCTYSDNFAYSTSARSVSISASTSTETAWKSSGYGPGKLSASGSYSVPAQYSTAGTFTAAVGAEDSVTMKLTGLPTAGYARTITWYHKLGTATSYSSDGTTSISASASPGTPSKAVAGLIPGTTYNFQASIKSSASTYKTWSANATTSAAAGSLAVDGVMPDSVKVNVTGLKSTTAIARSIKYSYKRSTDTAWTLAYTGSIAANAAAGTPTYTYGLMPGTAYNLKAELVAGGVTYKTLTYNVTTPYGGISVPQMIDPEIIADDGERLGHKVLQHRPSGALYIPWYIPEEQMDADSFAATSFQAYIQKATGDPVAVGDPVLGENISKTTINLVDETTARSWYWHATTVADTGWIDMDDETVTMFVRATNPFGDTFDAQPIQGVVGRRFTWDTSKDPTVDGELTEFLLTAKEWNRFYDYLVAAKAASITGFDTPDDGMVVETGDELSADLWNDTVYEAVSGISAVSQYGSIGNKLKNLSDTANNLVETWLEGV